MCHVESDIQCKSFICEDFTYKMFLLQFQKDKWCGDTVCCPLLISALLKFNLFNLKVGCASITISVNHTSKAITVGLFFIAINRHTVLITALMSP